MAFIFYSLFEKGRDIDYAVVKDGEMEELLKCK